MTRSPSLTRSSVAAALLLVLGLLAACTGGPPPDSPRPSPGPAVDGVFPVTIEHEFGGTVIPAAPRRIVTIGGPELDVLLALGMAPVGYATVSGPWTRFPAGGVPPTGARPVRVADGIPGVADVPLDMLAPDLILDMSGSPTPAVYDYFRGLAPTVGPPPGTGAANGAAWQDVTRAVGRAVGRPMEADRLVTATEARIAAAPARYPELRGRTAVCVAFDTRKGSTSGFSVDSPNPGGGTCGRFLAWFGMRAVPALAGRSGYLPAAEIAAARPDVVVLTDDVAVQPTSRSLFPPGQPVVTPDDTELAALSPSVLSVPVALDRVPGKLVRALR